MHQTDAFYRYFTFAGHERRGKITAALENERSRFFGNSPANVWSFQFSVEVGRLFRETLPSGFAIRCKRWDRCSKDSSGLSSSTAFARRKVSLSFWRRASCCNLAGDCSARAACCTTTLSISASLRAFGLRAGISGSQPAALLLVLRPPAVIANSSFAPVRCASHRSVQAMTIASSA